MSNTVRIGFIGVGAMGQCAHLQNYVALEGCEVVALAELREGLGRQVAARYGVPKVYANHRELLDAEKVDGLVASQPYHIHGRLLPDLFKAGLPVLTEKPLARSVEAGERVLAAVQNGAARHYVGYHKRSDPATIYARRTIESLKASGKLGPMRYLRMLMPAGDWVAGGFRHLVQSGDPVPPLATDPPPQDMDETTQAAYDAFVNYYIHQVNLMRHLLGEDYSVSYVDPARILMIGHSVTGVPCTLEMSPYQTTRDWQEEALVAFEHGYVRLELPAPLAANRPGRVTLFRDPGGGATPESLSPGLPWVSAMAQQAAHFIQAIRGEPTPLCEGPEALGDLRIARDYVLAPHAG